MVSPEYVPRLIDGPLERLVSELPAVMVHGPRACGKTTSAARLAAEVVRLDDPKVAELYRADPDGALAGRHGTLLLDEWQEVPEVLGAIKRAVDRDYSPGRFILTGSVRARWRGGMWPATGRVVSLRMGGLTERELMGAVAGPSFVERAVSAPESLRVRPTVGLFDYLALALRGGFPQLALGDFSAAARGTWLETYLDQLVGRDIEGLSPGRDAGRLSRYLAAVALSTAGLPTRQTLLEAADVTAATAREYDDLLAEAFVATTVPAWHTNRLKRLIKTGKRYVLDPGLAMAAAGVDAEGLRRSGDLIGRLLDTFVHAQLWPELALLPRTAGLSHLRVADGRHEVDLIAEHQGQIVGIEVKAGGVVTARDARHLAWLRDQLGDQFARGVVLHTGPGAYEVGERILAVPIAALWTTRA